MKRKETDDAPFGLTTSRINSCASDMAAESQNDDRVYAFVVTYDQSGNWAWQALSDADGEDRVYGSKEDLFGTVREQ